MRFNEFFDYFTPMPACSINIKPNRLMSQRSIQMRQNLQKSFSVTAFRLDHAATSEQRGHPTGDIQTLAVLTGRRNLQSASLLAPTPPEARMERKPGLVLENNGFTGLQRTEFFLKSSEISLRPCSWPEYKSNLPVSSGIPNDASTSAPDALSSLSRTSFLNERQLSAHPSWPCSTQNLAAFCPDGLQAPVESCSPLSSDDQAAASVSETRSPDRSPREATDSGSSESIQAHRLSSSDVVPRSPRAKQQSLSRSVPRGSCQQNLRVFLLLLQRELGSRFGFSCLQLNTKNRLCHFI